MPNLEITKEENGYNIKFYKNPHHKISSALCGICFALSGSRNQTISNAFSLIRIKLNDYFEEYESLQLLEKKKNI